MSVSEHKWVIMELVRGLLGNEEQFVRALKDFHASSVLLALREAWRVVSRVDLCSRVRVCGVWSLWDFGESGGSLFKAKIDGCRKE